MQKHEDILAALEEHSEVTSELETPKEDSKQIMLLDVTTHEDAETLCENTDIQQAKKQEHVENNVPVSALKKFQHSCVFLVKYMTTSLCIFGVLMVVSNYSAYYTLAQSIIYAEDMKQTKQSLIKSVAAAEISEDKKEEVQESKDTFRQLRKIEKAPKKIEKLHDISSYAQSSEGVDLGIEITPYENRVVIPKIGKNIPLVDIKQKKVEGVKELNDIFMKELENGVIRYPGSALPGEKGNSFIFGHSSNFPWLEGEYNDVFALLDKVVFDDEVVVYYGQEKHTYKIRTKDVIRPGDVSVLKSNEKSDRSQITLMTCWPIGTTLNRLVLTWDLINIEK